MLCSRFCVFDGLTRMRPSFQTNIPGNIFFEDLALIFFCFSIHICNLTEAITVNKYGCVFHVSRAEEAKNMCDNHAVARLTNKHVLTCWYVKIRCNIYWEYFKHFQSLGVPVTFKLLSRVSFY